MSRRNILIGLGIAVVLIVLGVLFPVELPEISAAAEGIPSPEHPWMLFGVIPITNALLTSWLTMIFLVVLAVYATRDVQLVPHGFQNVVEMVIAAIHDLVEDVSGPRLGRRFFPIVMTIFLFVLISNWIDLLTPVLAAVGFEETHGGETVIIPLLRAPSTDLNMTLGLALVSVFLTQVFGIGTQGFFDYVGRFIDLSGFRKFFAVLLGRADGNPIAVLVQGILDLYIGIIELIGEVAKVFSFSFRLFGNIFAGEVLLLVMPSLIGLLLPLPFLGLEVFVGLIQAFIFAMLTLVFMTAATIEH